MRKSMTQELDLVRLWNARLSQRAGGRKCTSLEDKEPVRSRTVQFMDLG
jgi:hypothetical protein